MQIRTKLIALSAAGLTVAASMFAVSKWSLLRIGDSTERMQTLSDALRNHLEGDMMHDAINSDVLAAQLAKTDDAKDQVRKDLTEHAEWFRTCLDNNKKLELPASVTAALSDAEPRLQAYIAAAESIVTDAKFSEDSLQSFDLAFRRLEEANEKLSDLLQDAAVAAADEQSHARQSAFTFSWIIAAVSAAAFGLISWLTGKGIVTQLERLRNSLARMAKGDLTDRLPTDSRDEIAMVAAEANTMADAMSRMVQDIRVASEQVAAAAQQIEATGEEVRRQTDAQVRSIEQLEQSLEEFARGTDQVATRSHDASLGAQESGAAAADGGEVVNEALVGMKNIDATVTGSADLIQDLGRRGEQIGQIIRVIDDIAEQTNLLALNAAIEAARAGEHGRGFAVVADEVRKLADRTTKATEEISQSISTIRQQTGRAVEQMNQGTTCVREGVQRAETARNRLQQIVAGTTQVSHMIADIAAAADQQRATTKSVVSGVSEITANSRAVRDGANESAQAATLLAENATRMRDLVNRFKVPATETVARPKSRATGSAALADSATRPQETGTAR